MTEQDNSAKNISGEALFERFENGETIDELNETLAQAEEDTEKEPANTDVGQEKATIQDEGEDAGEDTRETVQKKEEARQRTFTQRDVDYMIGKKTSELARKHSKLLDNLSKIMGVSRDEVTSAVQKQLYESEAEAAGVADAELYAKNKALEEENTAQKQQMAQEQFYSDINNQIAMLKKKAPRFNMDSAVENGRFVRLVSTLYEDAETRGDALELAYNAVFFDEALKTAARVEREKVITSVRSGQTRISEGAAGSSSGATVKIDVGKLTDEQIAELASRAANGEHIQF